MLVGSHAFIHKRPTCRSRDSDDNVDSDEGPPSPELAVRNGAVYSVYKVKNVTIFSL